MRILWKSLKWLILTLLFLLLLILGLTYYFIGTESGYRQVPKLLNQFTPFQLSYDELSGKLWGKQQWRNLHLTGPDGLDFRAEALIIDFAANELFSKRLHLPLVQLSHSELHLPQTANETPPPKEDSPLSALPEITLPLQIDIDALRVSELRLMQQQQELLSIHDVQSELHAQGNEVQLSLASAISQGKTADKPAALASDARLKGNIQLSGDYPLNLTGDANLLLADKPNQAFDVQIKGSALKPQFNLNAQGWLQAVLAGNAAVDLAAKTLASELNWQDIALFEQGIAEKILEIPQGNLQLSGAFEDLQFNLDTEVKGKDIPAIALKGSAKLSPQALRELDVVIKTLGGSIDLQGFAEFGEALNWQADLRVQNLDAKQYDKSLDAKLSAHIHTQGQQAANAPLAASFAIAELKGNWQQYPIQGSGDVEIHGTALQFHDVLLNLADNKVALSGQANAQEIDIQADINAKALGRIVPNVSGAVQGKVNLNGAATNPEIVADVAWQNLRVLQGEVELVNTKSGSVKTQGTLQALLLDVQAAVQGRDFPPLELAGKAMLDKLQAVKEIDVLVKTMEGTVALTGQANFAPQVDWDVAAKIAGLRPKYYLPDMQAEINTTLQAKGGIDAQGVLQTIAQLSDLSGTWQGQKLAGGLQAEVKGQDVEVKEIDMQVGDNRITGMAQLQGQQLSSDVEIQALNLAQLYPELRGALRGKLGLSGSAASPVIKAQLSGENIAFADNRVAGLQLQLDTGLQQGANFNNQINLSGIQAAGQKWSALHLKTEGQYQQHRLALQTEGGEYNLDMQAAGGFSAIDAWAGSIEKLAAQIQDLRWQLRRPSKVAFSPREVKMQDFCLADQYSAFCLNVAHQEQSQIEYAIDKIDPRSFAAFMPDNVRIESLLKGEGKIIRAANGALRGNADLLLTPGKITAQIEGKPPIVLNIKEASLKTQLNNQNSRSLLNIDFSDMGNIRADVGIMNFNQPQINGKLQLDIPNIGKFQHFIPQVSDLKGRVKGDIAVSGALDKPQATGEIVLENGALKVPEYATDLKDIRLKLSARRDGNIDIDGNIGTPKGNLRADGVLRLQPLNLRLKLDGKEMLLANAKTLRLLASPSFDIRIDPNTGVNVKGEIVIPEAAVAIPDTRSAVAISEDVVIVNNQTKDDAPYVAPAGSPLQADIAVRLGDKVFFKDPNMNIRLAGGITVMLRPAAPLRARGRIEVASGHYELYGQELNIKRGWVTFSDELTNPALDIVALREVENIEVGAKLSGTVKRMRLDLTSDPAMPDSAILSYLIFGRAPDSATDSTALLQTAAVVGTKGLFPDDLANKTGLDVFDLGVGGLKAGKYLMEDMYVGIKSDFFAGITKFLARYQITDRLSVEASSSQLGGNALDMTYEFETD